LNAHSGSSSKEINSENVLDAVYPSNAISAKLLELQAKSLAIEDTMAIVRKAFDKDNMDL
jgi:hypothetical protein